MRPYIKKDVFTVQFYGVHASRGKRVEFELFFQSDNLVEYNSQYEVPTSIVDKLCS